MNKNDRPINESDVEKQIRFNDFCYKDKFRFICRLAPNILKERIDIIDEVDSLTDKPDLVYALVINGRIIKIGSSTTSFKDRVSSYNCGKKAYRQNGTCSTTNYVVLQSILNINKNVDVYAFFPEKYTLNIWGEREEISLSKKYEKAILTELKKNGKFPILCTQR
ncbi:MAG: GIY-YIG nuclease family protein [Candidatus Marsarchaeota archaeon]|jgi:hypothetical protein|nr:GIY-YIG nuclease family protein [Candidatus Marsarchaeota archaeon]MCL5418972.1 GIY-YIG nuclease family protein [Candidatus Marsarchaeota archaeon]